MIAPVLLFIGLRYSERRRVSLRASEDVLLLEAGIEDLGEASVLLVTSFFGERNPSFLAVAAHREHSRLREHHGGDKHIQLIARCRQATRLGMSTVTGGPRSRRDGLDPTSRIWRCGRIIGAEAWRRV